MAKLQSLFLEVRDCYVGSNYGRAVEEHSSVIPTIIAQQPFRDRMLRSSKAWCMPTLNPHVLFQEKPVSVVVVALLEGHARRGGGGALRRLPKDHAAYPWRVQLARVRCPRGILACSRASDDIVARPRPLPRPLRSSCRTVLE